VAILTLALFLILLGIVQAAPLLRPLLAPGNPITDPPGNTHTAPLTTTVSITYDEPISPTTVSIQTFAVFASQTGLLTQTYGVVSGTITLTPTLPFKPGELVQISATTGTLNLSGQGPISPTVWQFWTRVDGGSGIFVPHLSAPTFGGGSRAAVVLGDVDGDNDLDVVDASGDSQRVYLNDGTGQFTPHPIAPTFGGGNSLDLALGDIDGDGDLDAVVANYNQAQGVYVNNGTGLFVPHPIAPTFGDGYSYDLVLGDVDGDGDLDAVVGNGTYHATYVNNGIGQFSPHPDTPTFSTGTYFTDLVMGDVDGDGDLDIVAAQASSSPQQVHLNDGTGQFAPHPTAPTFGAGNSFALALGDVDGDGDLDAIVGNSDSDLVLYLNDGIGQFSLHPTDPTFGFGSVQVVTLGDVDGDGDLDAVVSHGAAGIYIYRNAGTGQFTSHSSFSDDEFIALGDVDGDGDLDIVTADGQTSPDRVWLNRNAADLGIAKSVVPNGTLGRSDAITYTLTYSNAGAQIASGVIIIDLVPVTVTQISFARSGALVTPTGSISYTWQVQDLAPGIGGVITIYGHISSAVTGLFTLTNQATITTTRLDVMDVSKDNNEAVAHSQVEAEPTIVTGVAPAPNTHAVSTSTNLSVTFNAPISTTTVTSRTLFVHGGFQGHIPGAIYPPITGTLHWDDITFDPFGDFSPGELVQATVSTGVLDASDNAPVLPYVWQFWADVAGGSGEFNDNGQSLGSSSSRAVALGDLDGDGDLDAFVANIGTGPFGEGGADEIWLNDGMSTFTDSGQSLGSSTSYAVALGDLDGDSDLDAFVGGVNKVWLNDGGVQGGTSGNFTDSGQSLDTSYAVALGDLDGDGDLDALASPKVWLNDGWGTFTDSGQSLVGSAGSTTAALGDLDKDGDIDAVASFEVWLNDGWGTFTDSGQGLGTSSSRAVVLGDLDRDGDLDVFVGNWGQANKVWLNDGGVQGGTLGTFTDSGQSLGSSLSRAVTLGDVDGDDDLDAFVGNTSQANKVWLNGGWGTFTDSGQSLGSFTSRAVVLGDLDGDGDLDTFVGNGGDDTGDENKVWLNRNALTDFLYLPLVLRNHDPRLPYFDDFGNPNSGWYIGDVGDVRWGYQDGEYEILLRNADWWWDAVLAPLGCVTDYSVEADMRRYSGSTTAYGLIFGWQDWDHLYVFMVEPAYQYYSVWRRAFPGDPYWVPLVDWTPSSYINPVNTTNHLKVEHDGSQITVYVNNQFLATVNDSAYTGCLQVGLYVSTDPASPSVPATVRYDNFQVGHVEATTVIKLLSRPYSLAHR
jgi:uncharacterized repeat protein (TIGR01451 family)